MGNHRVLMGNQAIAFGALKAGVEVAAGYPGTPSTEIIETLKGLNDSVYAEWSINEKVALETAYGAAMMGSKALAAMKHVGMNVAADPLFSSSYTGVDGALVIVSADDPSMWSSQNEQDNRYYGLHALIPVIEPYDPQSAYDLTIKAFEISEKLRHPVILRTTTRVGHVRSQVNFERDGQKEKKGIEKNPGKYVMAPENARRDRVEQIDRWNQVSEYIERLNVLEDNGSNTLIIASGIAYPYVKEITEEEGLNANIFRLVTPVPIPEKSILDSMTRVKKVLVVEENDPVVELQLSQLMVKNGIMKELHGKDLVSPIGELTLEKVRGAIMGFFGKEYVRSYPDDVSLRTRPPALCPGCPHRSSFYDIKKGLSKVSMQKAFFSGDIGCYTLGALPPFNEQDSATNMGSSVGISNGVFRATGQIPVSIIGDSTFFHSGLQGVANAVYNGTPEIIIVLDNRSTAMTGQQPSPSTHISIENVARAMGIDFVDTFDPFDVKEGSDAVQKAAEYVKENKKPALIVAKRACALEVLEKVGDYTMKAEVDLEKCTGCSICYDFFTCPSILPLSNKKAFIDDSCIGCGACVEVCPFNAIKVKGNAPKGWIEAWNL